VYAYAKLLPYAKTYFNNDIIATAAVVAEPSSARSSSCR